MVFAGSPANHQTPLMPAKAGIQFFGKVLGLRFRGDERKSGASYQVGIPAGENSVTSFPLGAA